MVTWVAKPFRFCVPWQIQLFLLAPGDLLDVLIIHPSQQTGLPPSKRVSSLVTGVFAFLLCAGTVLFAVLNMPSLLHFILALMCVGGWVHVTKAGDSDPTKIGKVLETK